MAGVPGVAVAADIAPASDAGAAAVDEAGADIAAPGISAAGLRWHPDTREPATATVRIRDDVFNSAPLKVIRIPIGVSGDTVPLDRRSSGWRRNARNLRPRQIKADKNTCFNDPAPHRQALSCQDELNLSLLQFIRHIQR